MFERFSDRSRRVVVLAQEEARQLRHNVIGTEHLLLGLIGESGGVGAMALCSVGITLEATRGYVSEWVGVTKEAVNGSPPFTERAKTVLGLSLQEELDRGDPSIGTGHLLLGLVREGEGVGCQVLMAQGADLDQVAEVTRNLMSGHRETSSDTPSIYPVGDARRLLRALWESKMIRRPDSPEEELLWDAVAREFPRITGDAEEV